MQDNNTFALENGKVITPLRIIEDGVVVIRGGKIADLGAKGALKVPPDCKKIDEVFSEKGG